MDNINIFAELNAVDVSKYVEKKNGMSYLSWANAWAELKKRCPNANFRVIKNPEELNYHTDGRTCWVEVALKLERDGDEVTETLPVMDYRNQSIALDKVTSMDVNKAIKRCLAKAIALHGLGLYIYAGEDLPESVDPEPAPKAPKAAPAVTAKEPEKFVCTACGQIIKPVTYEGKEYPVRQIAAMATKNFGKPMCWDCMKKAKEEKNNA